MIADTFTKSLGALASQDQGVVKQAAFDFQLNPAQPGAQFHRLERVRDKNFWSFRVNRDVRIIVYKSSADFVLLYADHHDRAYAWAEHRQFVENPRTGAMQVVQVEERIEEIVRHIVREVEAEAPLFRHFERDYLLALGVPERWLDAVQSVGDTGFYELLDHLPQEASENLMKLADGQPVPRPESVGGDPFLHPDAQRRFVVLGDDQELLARALDAPWEQWIVFLHPSQAEAASKSYSGPAKLAGGAGTGKTVVALHRAVGLRQKTPGARVLLTTYSRTLAARLQQQLGLLEPTRASIHVEHLHRLAVRLWQERTQRPFRLLTEDELSARLARLNTGELSLEFLKAEWEGVVAPQGVRSWDAYKTVPRAGRGVPLGLRQRKAVWEVLGALQRDLEAEGIYSFEGLCAALGESLEADEVAPFDHVVADEVQDFGPAELRLLRALVKPAPDDLFLTGDLGQRIYKAGSSFLASGINIRGRSSILRLNYRTTEQIRRYADALLPGSLKDDDGEDETRATVSLLSGPAPEVLAFAYPHQETQSLAERLRYYLKNGYAPRDVAIFTRTRSVLEERVLPVLELAGVKGVMLSDDAPPGREHISLGTMHRAKGLEFRVVIVAGCDAEQLPLASVSRTLADAAARSAFAERERNLLYVACTRAREQLVLSYVGAPSALLKAFREP